MAYHRGLRRNKRKQKLLHANCSFVSKALWDSAFCNHATIGLLRIEKMLFSTKPPKQKSSLDPVTSKYLTDHLPEVADLPEKQQKKLHRTIIETLEPVFGRNIQVSHLESFGISGLQALAASILRQQVAKPGNDKNDYVTVRFQVPHHKTEFDLKWYYESQSLLDIAEDHPELLAEYLEATCGGNASCCTCHVYVQKNHNEDLQISKLEEAEEDMLDLAYQPKEESRLACQVRLVHPPPDNLRNSEDPAVTIVIPSGVNNVWN
jgi:2Fe-2S ferredoxin